MEKESVLALLFVLNFLKVSVFVTITAMTHPQTSVQISLDVFKYPFVLRSSLIEEIDGPGASFISFPVNTTTQF